ncbi:unnamed protein product [Coffea canephora]|uniref:Uncharacterized protein n=1 Tax=Coffea canephora TaxID=49390 RepID=A0A068UIT0_COFCA|nr:unnamed protein product [Coffea canephora]
MDDVPHPVLKKTKIRKTSGAGEEEEEDREETTTKGQEEALVYLIEHRTKEVEFLRHRITYYATQLDQAENRLEESKIQLACIRGHDSPTTTKAFLGNEQDAASPSGLSEYSSKNQPKLVIPSIPASSLRASQLVKTKESGSKVASSSSSQQNAITPTNGNTCLKVREDRPYKISPDPEVSASQTKAAKSIIELKEHKQLIPLVRSSSSPIMIRYHTASVICSQHRRKLRSLTYVLQMISYLRPVLWMGSSTCGRFRVKVWVACFLYGKRRSSAYLLSTTDCASAKQRRWPEDIAWHPQGDSLFSVYSADNGDTQIAILNLNKTKEETRASFLEKKPHVKGIINSITFMPWKDTCFVTGGSDHAVFLWTEKDGENPWEPKMLHQSMHSSAVMGGGGVSGLQRKTTVLSAGADKRIIGYDVASERAGYKYQIESKCMSTVPNPCNFNLFMVQTGTPERQLRLFDIRLRNTELHAFGRKQESSESQSALINQALSQSIKAHQKRVFKALWHQALPLLISISSDLNIGLHNTN